MLRHNPDYRRLKVDSAGLVNSASYWLAPDHLLIIVNSGFMERYRRIDLADIQALMVRKTRAHLGWSVSFATVALMGLASGFRMWFVGAIDAGLGYFIWATILLAIGAVFGALFLINWLRGPDCVCHLRTGVQVLLLPQIIRWKRGERMLTELAPRITAVQSQGQREEVGSSGASPAPDLDAEASAAQVVPSLDGEAMPAPETDE